MLEYVVYHSRAALPEGDRVDREILRAARARNPVDGLTGFLHREGDRYFQFIEGPREPLAAVLGRIERDRRHHSMVMLRRGSRGERAFGGWSMGRVEPGARLLSERLGTTALAAIQAPTVIAFLQEASLRQSPPAA